MRTSIRTGASGVPTRRSNWRAAISVLEGMGVHPSWRLDANVGLTPHGAFAVRPLRTIIANWRRPSRALRRRQEGRPEAAPEIGRERARSGLRRATRLDAVAAELLA